MAINRQFADIFKKYPNLARTDEAATEQQQPVVEQQQPVQVTHPFGKINFTPVKVEGNAPSPFGTMKSAKQESEQQHKIAAVITVDEDNTDDDPALAAVADKPYDKKAVVQSAPADNVTVKQAKLTATEDQKEQSKAEEPKAAVKEEQQAPAKTEKTKKQTKTKPVVDTAEADDIEDQYAIENPEKYFKEKVALFRQRYIQQGFQEYKTAVFKRLAAIKIDSSLNPGAIRVRIAEIDALRSEIIELAHETQALLKASFSKDYGDVFSTASMASEGGNDTARRNAYFTLLKKFPITADENVNMTFICTVLEIYNQMFQTVLSELSLKYNMLVTFQNSLKIENNAS